MFTHELQQLAEEYPQVVLPPQPIRQHNAMHDARWVQEAFKRINDVRNLPAIKGDEVEAEVIEEPLHWGGFSSASGDKWERDEAGTWQHIESPKEETSE